MLGLLILLEIAWVFKTKTLQFPESRSPETYHKVSTALNRLGAFTPEVIVTALDPSCAGDPFYNLESPQKTIVPLTVISEKDRLDPHGFRKIITESEFRYVLIEPCDIKTGLEWVEKKLPEGFYWVEEDKTYRIMEIPESL